MWMQSTLVIYASLEYYSKMIMMIKYFLKMKTKSSRYHSKICLIDFIIIRKFTCNRKYFTSSTWIKILYERRCGAFFLGQNLFKLGISTLIDKKTHLVRVIGWIKPTLRSF